MVSCIPTDVADLNELQFAIDAVKSASVINFPVARMISDKMHPIVLAGPSIQQVMQNFEVGMSKRTVTACLKWENELRHHKF